MLIIGVVGQIASGKGVLVSWLTDNLGFKSFSLSSIVHDEFKKRKVVGVGFSDPLRRKTLQDIGDEMRRKEGDDVLAKKAINKCSGLIYQTHNNQKIVIEGIRNPAEIKFFKKNQNFILIGVKASRAIRFKRLLLRGKEWDPKTYKDFLKVDRRDLGVGQNKSGQQVGECLKYCDYVVTNNKNKQDFEEKIRKLMEKILLNS